MGNGKGKMNKNRPRKRTKRSKIHRASALRREREKKERNDAMGNGKMNKNHPHKQTERSEIQEISEIKQASALRKKREKKERNNAMGNGKIIIHKNNLHKQTKRSKIQEASALRRQRKKKERKKSLTRQKQLAEQRAADLLDDVNESVHRTLDSVITEVISGVPQRDNSLDITTAVKDGHLQTITESDVGSLGTLQSVSNHDPYTLPLVPCTNIEAFTLPDLFPVGKESTPKQPVVKESTPKQPIVKESTSKQPIVKEFTSKQPIVKESIPKQPIVKESTPEQPIVKESTPKPHGLRTHYASMGTQVNFDDKKLLKTKEKREIKPVIIKGRRIINFKHFFSSLKRMNNHSAFGCNLNNIVITNEKQRGICTGYYLKCNMCDFEKVLWSENVNKKNNLNTDFISSMLSIKCSFEATNKLLANLCLPLLNQSDFVRECNKVLLKENDSMETCENFQNISKNTNEIEKTKPQENFIQQCDSSASDSDDSDSSEQVNSNSLLIQDQFEIKEEENVVENEFLTILPQQRTGTSDDKLIVGQEQEMPNMAIIKKEITSDSESEELSNSVTEGIKTPNKESFIENDRQSKAMLCQQKEAKACKNAVNVNQDKVQQQKNAVIKHFQGNNKLVGSELSMEITRDFDYRFETELPFKKAKILTDKEVVNQLTKTKFTDGGTTNKKTIKSCYESITTNKQVSFAINEDSDQIFITAKLNNPASTHEIPTIPSKEREFCKSRFESNRLETTSSAAATYANNVNTISSATTNAIATSISTTDSRNMYLIPVQSMPTFNENNGLIVPQISHNVASGTFQGIPGSLFMPETSNVVQQNNNQSSGGIIPLTAMHQPWTGSFTTPAVNNPLFIIPSAGGTIYMPRAPTATQQPASFSNVSLTASGSTYVPLPPGVVQPANSSNSRPPLNTAGPRWIGRANMNNNDPSCTLPGGVRPLNTAGPRWIGRPNMNNNDPSCTLPGSVRPLNTAGPRWIGRPNMKNNDPSCTLPGGVRPLNTAGPRWIGRPNMNNNGPSCTLPGGVRPLNTAGPRWIGRANMNNNDPSCTLPGGAPKGVSDPDLPKSDSNQFNHQSKRPRFYCADCNINFAKYESLDSHKKFYCIKRLKLLPTSTVTSNMLTNNPIQPSSATSSSNPHIKELLSAMTVKRSFLEASMKAALDAQYIINLYKSAQDLTQKTLKELDDVLYREKALTPEASLEEQQIVAEAKAQALMKAEAAYNQEKYSAVAVEQALYKQKTSIEATLTATGHEQSALISTLRGLKVQTNQNDLPSDFRFFDETSFNQEKISNTLQEQTKEQEVVANKISTNWVPVHETPLCNLDFLMKKTNEMTKPAHDSVLQNVSHFNIISEKLNAVNLERNKTVVPGITSDSSQHKEINGTISCSSSNVSTFQIHQKRPSLDYLHSHKILNLNLKTSTEHKKESVSHDCSHPHEPGEKRIFSENTPAVSYPIDFTQRIKSEEMMDT